MCRFTRLYWTQCGHYTLSNAPEHTELCEIARDPDEEIRQGFDKAPAFCHPMPQDLEEPGTLYHDSDRIAQTNCLFTSCDVCRLHSDFNSGPRGAGSEIEKPVEQFGEYTDEDRMELAKWRDLLLSNTTKAEAAIRDLEELLENDCETAATAIQGIRDETIQSALLNCDGPERWALFRKSHQEAKSLLDTVDSYMITRMPRKFANDLIEVVQDKLYQADLRLSIFKLLTKSIASHSTNPKAYEAALNMHADKLMTRLGYPVLPDPDMFEHLTVEMPQHVQDTVATKENVRRLSIEKHTSILRTHPYAPRLTFGDGKNSKALTIDLERAWKPPLERAWDLPVLRKMGENVEVTYNAGLETCARLRHMGVGRWEEGQMRVQRETLGCVSGGQEDRQDGFGDNDDTLVESPRGSEKAVSASGGNERMVEKEARLIGMPLEDSDEEVSDAEEGEHGGKAVERDAGRQEPVKSDMDRAGKERDEQGRFVKKRKCSG